MANKKRIDLLSQAEIDDLYARPVFNKEERCLYFSLTHKEFTVAMQYSNERTQLYFILQLGYFKAKQQFYSFNLEEVIEDARTVNELYLKNKAILSGRISREYSAVQRETILRLCGYEQFSEKNAKQIMQHLGGLLQIYPKAHNALRQLMVHFNQGNIIIPAYRTLQDLFTSAYRVEKERLDKLMQSIPADMQENLQNLIKTNDGLTELNIIRADQKDFLYTAVRLEVGKANKIADLYVFSKSFIPKMEISKNAVQYYADITEQYAPFRLRKLSQPSQWLHLTCFISHRYQQLMDNLIVSFIYVSCTQYSLRRKSLCRNGANRV